MNKTYSVLGMTCGHCAMRVKDALENVDGVESAVVDQEKGTASINATIDVPIELIKNAVSESGYSVAAEIS